MSFRTKWIFLIAAVSLSLGCGLFGNTLIEAADTTPTVADKESSANEAPGAAAELGRQIAYSINNLKQLGLVCKMYMSESKGQVCPRLSKTAGCLMMSKDAIYPEYLTDCNIMISPLNPDAKSLLNSGRVDSNSYIYLGYLVETPEDVDLFLKMYEAGVRAGSSFEQDLKDTASGKTLYRLREGVERLVTPKSDAPAASEASIPFILERRAFYKDGKAPVIFFDGHAEQIGPGENKVIDRIFELLPKFEALSKQL